MKMPALVVLGLLFSHSVSAKPISLTVGAFHHVTFKGIPPTHYANSKNVLTMAVDNSSSVLVLPFSNEHTLSQIEFTWRTTLENASVRPNEQTKAGDDFPLRVGLMVSGPAPLLPFFAPAWIKAVRDIVKIPSDKLIYLAAGTQSAPGTRWPSPYSSSIQTVSVGGEQQKEGWQRSQFKMSPTKITGLWIMADGDDTGVQFTTELMNLEVD